MFLLEITSWLVFHRLSRKKPILILSRKTSEKAGESKQDKAEMAFKLYDKDKDGYITKAEMVKLSKTLTREQVSIVCLFTIKSLFF